MKIQDQFSRSLQLDKIPQRIVYLVPSQTELLVDLGLEKYIKGVTAFCVHPERLRKEKIIVGGPKKVNYDKIKELNPDIILCNKEENTKEMVETLAKDYPLHISNIETLEDTYELISQYGQLFDVEEKAKEINEKIQAEARKFESFIRHQPKLKVVYFIWRNPWMVVGGGTFVNHLLEVNGFENVYADIPRYPEIQLEELRSADVMLLSSEPYPFREKHIPDVIPFAKGSPVTQIDGEYFAWYGSRLIRAFDYFRKWREELGF